jgi:hypothetical protein
MIKKILLGLVVLVAGVAVVAYFQPADFVVERSAVIPAPAADVFPLVNDFHKWGAWSPWEKMDPQMKRTYDGPAAGKGAKYAWVGDKEVSDGNMTITESKPNELILLDLNFTKPFESNCLTEFKFASDAGGTKVNWKMSGKKAYAAKVMGLFKSMDAMIGPQFEEGLNNMKTAAKPAATPAATQATGTTTPTGPVSTGVAPTGAGS